MCVPHRGEAPPRPFERGGGLVTSLPLCRGNEPFVGSLPHYLCVAVMSPLWGSLPLCRPLSPRRSESITFGFKRRHICAVLGAYPLLCR